MPVDASIPLRVETPKFITPADLLSLKDLQTRARMNEFNLEQAPENARMDRELKQSEIDYRRQMSLGQIGKQKKDQEAADYEEAVRHASALVSATPQQRIGIWKTIRQWSVSKDPQNEAKLPQEWDESLLPKFQALAFGALKPEQAIERGAYPGGPPAQAQPPQVPLQNIDQYGAITRPMPMMPSPEGVPLSDIGNGLPPEEAAFQSQLETTGQATAPPVGVTAPPPDETPDSIRAAARATKALGGPENQKMYEYEMGRASKLEDTIHRQREISKPGNIPAGVIWNQAKNQYEDTDGKRLTSKQVQDIEVKNRKAGASNVNVGMTAGDAAKAELLNQGISDIEEFKGIIMPKGEVDRDIVLGLSAPGMAGIPGTDSRIAYSLIYNSIEAKLRAESGAAVPKEEVERMAARFIPSPLDNDETIKSKIRRMEAFLRGSFGRIKGAGEPTTKTAAPVRATEEKSVETWEDSQYMYRKLPDGTVQRKKK